LQKAGNEENMNIIFDKICIRNAVASDCGQLAAWWNDGKVMVHAGFPKGIATKGRNAASRNKIQR